MGLRSQVVVTGSSKGLGLAISEKFLELGDHVVLAARNEAALSKAVELLQQKFPGQTVRGQACDVGRLGKPQTNCTQTGSGFRLHPRRPHGLQLKPGSR